MQLCLPRLRGKFVLTRQGLLEAWVTQATGMSGPGEGMKGIREALQISLQVCISQHTSCSFSVSVPWSMAASHGPHL
jgi:hypothetical protein